MTAPTERAMRAFWGSQPEGDYTCSDCGTVAPKTYVQPQHPYYANGQDGVALCGECISRHNREIKAVRKAELAAAPRCSLCARRAVSQYSTVRLCGQHRAAVRKSHARNMSGAGFLGLFTMPNYTAENILAMAVMKG